ncbi:hypothetical protein PTKIN_Ptkin16aG0036800 [Pterospermum kingtungense]
MAKEIMKTQDLNFCSRPTLRGQQKLSYNGLDLAFAPYDSHWREIRKICVVHLFNPNRVLLQRPIREDEVARMIEKISKSSVGSRPVNLSEILMCLTNTIICRVGFGKRYEEDGAERSIFHAVSGLLGRLEKNFKDFDIFYLELIDEHLDPNRPKPEQEDILDVLLEIWRDRAFKVDLTLEHIKAVLMNVFVGGSDTSSATVVWAMTFLMKNPRCMKKVQEEIRNSVGNKGFVSEEDIQGLPYFNAVIKETLRLQPTVPLLVPRETINECKLSGYTIPAKTLVFVNAWAVGRDPEAWENPNEFYPERFIGSSLDVKGFDYELIPFGAGRRGCPGIYMGLATVEIALANLLYKFDWDMPVELNKDDLDFDVIPGIVVHKKNALRLVAREKLIELGVGYKYAVLVIRSSNEMEKENYKRRNGMKTTVRSTVANSCARVVAALRLLSAWVHWLRLPLASNR